MKGTLIGRFMLVVRTEASWFLGLGLQEAALPFWGGGVNKVHVRLGPGHALEWVLSPT